MKVLHETDTLVLGQEPDQLRALAIMLMIGTLSEIYGTEPAFTFVERLRAQIEAGKYGILYERAKKDAIAPMPVAFITWGHLSRPAEVIFEKRFRPLQTGELSSGPTLWVIDMAAPLGHMASIKAAFDAACAADQESYFATRLRAGKWRKETFKPGAK